MIALKDRDLRFETPLYTVAEAARVIGVPSSTLATWTKGYVRQPPDRPSVVGEAVVTAFPTFGQLPSIPFVGLAEALVLAAVRRSGVPMQRVRPALAALEREIGIDHALASSRLYTDGAEVLFDFGTTERFDPSIVEQLVVVRNGQRVFVEVVTDYLKRIEYASDGYAKLIRVPGYHDVVCDPNRSFGRPIFRHGGVRVDEVLSRFQTGESIDALTAEFGVTVGDVEDALRVASRRAA